MTRWAVCFVFYWVWVGSLHAQVGFSLFVPGNYKSNNVHRIEISNSANRRVDLSGYLLVTRDYVFVFPTGTSINPNGTISLAKQSTTDNPADLSLFRHPNFKIKLFSDPKVEGNFCALLNSQKQMIDGFYHAPLPNVPFLPDSDDVFIENRLYPNYYKLPPENKTLWQYIPVGNDPAIGFEKTANGWRVTSSRKGINPHAITSIQNLTARYREPIVTLRWSTAFEYGLGAINIERSEDQIHFQSVGTVESQNRRTTTATEYVFYDNQVQAGKRYYYRLHYKDDRNKDAYSKIIYLEARAVKREFWMESLYDNQHMVSIRFYSAYSQRVKIKLYNKHFREIAILYENPVFAEAQNLLRLKEPLPSGKYILVATIDNKRYIESFIIE
jgi:hypothetical protein